MYNILIIRPILLWAHGFTGRLKKTVDCILPFDERNYSPCPPFSSTVLFGNGGHVSYDCVPFIGNAIQKRGMGKICDMPTLHLLFLYNVNVQRKRTT